MGHAEKLHHNSIIIDGTCPLARYKGYWENYLEGGATAIAPTVNKAPELFRETMTRVGTWLETLRKNRDTLLQIYSVEDIYRAKDEGKLGIIFAFQGTTPFETDLNFIEIYHRLGLRMVQITYNIKDFVGDGCTERTDCGLSDFGLKLIKELDRLGIVVDCSHTGYHTTMEAIEVSDNPVIISHGNARAVCNSKRNLPDDVLLAIAKNGGVVGLCGYPDFVSHQRQSTLGELIDHAEYMANLIGIDHISIGIDFFPGQAGVAGDEEASACYREKVDSGVWDPKVYSPPPMLYPTGLEMPEKLNNLTSALVSRSFSDEDIQKIMGLNLIRIFKKVWS